MDNSRSFMVIHVEREKKVLCCLTLMVIRYASYIKLKRSSCGQRPYEDLVVRPVCMNLWGLVLFLTLSRHRQERNKSAGSVTNKPSAMEK